MRAALPSFQVDVFFSFSAVLLLLEMNPRVGKQKALSLGLRAAMGRQLNEEGKRVCGEAREAVERGVHKVYGQDGQKGKVERREEEGGRQEDR